MWVLELVKSVNVFFNELNATIESKLANQNEELLSSLNVLRHETLETLRERTEENTGVHYTPVSLMLKICGSRRIRIGHIYIMISCTYCNPNTCRSTCRIDNP